MSDEFRKLFARQNLSFKLGTDIFLVGRRISVVRFFLVFRHLSSVGATVFNFRRLKMLFSDG